MPDPASAYLVESHLAAGAGWVLSTGRVAATGEQVLVVSSEVGDLADLRRRLAVAGSVAGPHLAAVSSAEDSAAGGSMVVVTAPSGPSLTALVDSRGLLAAGEVVTLVGPLASTLASLHARGLELADVTASTVWLAADGRPLLLPVGLRNAPDPATDGADHHDDLVALATTGLSVLDAGSSGAAPLAAVLSAATEGRIDAAGLAAAVMRSVPAVPVALRTVARPKASAVSTRRPSRPRPPLLRAAAVVAAVVALGIVLGGLWAHHDGDVVAAASPLPPVPVSPTTPATPAVAARAAPRDWRFTVAALESARARAYTSGDAASLSAVYAVGSPTGRADLRMLRQLVLHGQRATGLQALVERVTVITRTDDRALLQVTDALTAYDVVGRDGQVVRHGSGRPSRTWRMTLVRTALGWRIWSVS